MTKNSNGSTSLKITLFLLFIPCFLDAYSYIKSLDKVYKQDEFRIYYTLEGKNALPKKNRLDANKNNVPDYVENIANQLSESSRLFIDTLGFVHPLKQPRFKGKAEFIDIHLIPIKVNGAAGDTVYKKNGSLVMKLSIDLIPTTLTPVHEFFHLIQYGYSMFNNRWSMEGQARWAEYAFRKGSGRYKELPSSIKELEKLTKMIYESSYFWERAAFLSDKECRFEHKKKYKNIFKGEFWIEDEKLCGYRMIKNILENYQKYDKDVERLYGFASYMWNEKDQKSSNNDLYIFLSVRDALNDLPNRNKEITDFIEAVDNYKEMLKNEFKKNDLTKNLMIHTYENIKKKLRFNNIREEKPLHFKGNIFPTKYLYAERVKQVIRKEVYKDKIFYIGAYKEKNAQITPFGIYESSNKNDFKTKEIKLNSNYKPWDIKIYDKYIYILVQDDYALFSRYLILRSPLNDLADFEQVIQFRTKERAVSFDMTRNNDIYLLTDDNKILSIKKD